jgi:competence protein ComEC
VNGVVLVAAMLAGIVAGLLTSISSYDAAALALAITSGTLLAPAGRVRAVLLLSGLSLIATTEGAIARDRAIWPPLLRWFDAETAGARLPDPIIVRGVLAADATLVDSGVRLLVLVDELETSRGRWRIRGTVQTTVEGNLALSALPEWTAGRWLSAPMMLREPAVLRNPGGASEHWQRLRRISDLTGTIKSARLIEIHRGAWWDEAGASVRQQVRDATRKYIVPPLLRAAPVLPAVLIGDQAGLPIDVEHRLQAAGTYHAIVISGAHIAVLSAACFFLLRLVLRSFHMVALTTMVIVATYGWLVGDAPSVRRAVTAAGLYLGLSVIGLRARALNVLAVTALCLAIASPLTTIDASAWLSFGATLGIIVGGTRFMEWASAQAPNGRATPRAAVMLARRMWLVMLGIFSATLAAELVLTPIVAALFSRVGLLALVLNLVAIPAIAVVQVAGVMMIVFDHCWTLGAQWSGWIAGVAALVLLDSSKAVDLAPWLIWRTPPTHLAWTIAYYVSLVIAVSLRGRSRSRILAVAAASASLLIILSAPGLELARPRAGSLRMTMLDVGQGDAIAVQCPDGQSLLIDTGGAPGAFDVGDRVVTPALWALGVRRLDWLALTHGDLDHAGGALGVERNLHPREIWEGIPVPPHPLLLALRRQAHLDGVAWREILAGHRLEIGSVAIDALHPPPPDWERRRVRNDDSLVLRIRFGTVELLLTGDAGGEFENQFVEPEGRGRIRVLKVGHHGSRSSSATSFLKSFAPQLALISVGRGNTFGHPDPAVVTRLQQLGAVVFRTDWDGAILLDTDGRTVDVTTMSGRRWQVTVSRAS